MRFATVLLCLLTLIFAAGSGRAQQIVPDNLNVERVGFAGGQFIQNGGEWVEQGDNGSVFNFVEDSRSVGGVLLYDASRDVWITLDVVQNVILYRQGELESNRVIYDITWAVANANANAAAPPPEPEPQPRLQVKPEKGNPDVQAATSCPAGTVPVPETDNCIPANASGFEVAPWNKPECPGLQAACDAGNSVACGEFESTCQVN